MFGFGKRHVDESLDEQKQELERHPPTFKDKALNGLDCDSLTGDKNNFGHLLQNPVPVNGIRGEFKYLGRLRCADGVGLMWHRLGSIETETVPNPVDVYEVVCVEGKHWDILYIHPYHPRRSTWPPSGYRFSEFHPVFSKLPFGYGTNQQDEEFPFGLSKFIVLNLGPEYGEALARKYEFLVADRSKFIRPESHEKNLERLK